MRSCRTAWPAHAPRSAVDASAGAVRALINASAATPVTPFRTRLSPGTGPLPVECGQDTSGAVAPGQTGAKARYTF